MKKPFLLGFLFVSIVSVSFAQLEKRRQQYHVDKSFLAISGYDPTSYFSQKKPVEGKKNIAVAYEGITYYFASEQNKKQFVAAPKMYEPQYGGWCAYAMGATGEKVEVDPETYKIVDGKLYLFYNKYFTNTLKSWNKDEAKLKSKADESWKNFYK